jgi:hypothetical protein
MRCGVFAGDMINVFFEYSKVTAGGTVTPFAGRDVPAKDCTGTFIGACTLLGEIDNDTLGCRG